MAKKRPSSSTKKKRRKTRKDKGTKKPATVKVETPKTDSKLLRLDAGWSYISEAGMSLADMRRADLFDGKFAGVALVTLKKWCKEDNWVERRRLFHEKYGEKLLAKLGGDFLRAQSAMLRQFQGVYDEVLEAVQNVIRAKGFQPEEKQLPAYLNVLTRMMVAQSQERLALADHVIPEIPGAIESPGPDEGSEMHPTLVPNLSRDEEIQIVQKLLKGRLEQSRQEMLESGDLTHEDLYGIDVTPKRKKRPPKKTVKK